MITHLVDTDWLVDCLNEKNSARDVLRPLVEAGRVATSVIVIAELHEGLLGDRDPDRKRLVLEDLLAGIPVIGLAEATARQFAKLRFNLRSTGQMINDHDIWIAATALEHSLILVSRDKHFERISELKRNE